jgi:hypothetical protein
MGKGEELSCGRQPLCVAQIRALHARLITWLTFGYNAASSMKKQIIVPIEVELSSAPLPYDRQQAHHPVPGC